MIQYGIAAARGKMLARAKWIRPAAQVTGEERLETDAEEAEKEAKEAIEKLTLSLKRKETQCQGEEDGLRLEMLTMQQTMLRDPYFYDGVCAEIRKGYAPEAAVHRCIEEQCRMMESLGDPYMAARAEDFRDIGGRLECQILGREYPDVSDLEEEVILVGETIPPSLLVHGDGKRIRGILLEKGSKTAHVCILAANMGIPAVVGCKKLSDIEDGECLYLDGTCGSVRFQMTPKEQEAAEKEAEEERTRLKVLEAYREKDAVTKDGISIQVLANIMGAEAADMAKKEGAQGIGLFRTEFLYMERKSLPSEEEQYRAYRTAAEKTAPGTLVIRTMDIGGDKEAEALGLPKEENPFLGYRAIRICLRRKDIFMQQLRAILRASVYGKIRIMFPMISCMEELEEALRILEEAKEQLREEGIEYDGQIQAGMMVEVPSAAVLAGRFAKRADFFSIGSNDLTQYTLAADRQNEQIFELYDYFHPAVLMLIKGTLEAGDKAGKECSLCGEMAADPLAIPLLLGLGLRKFSVNPAMVPLVKYLLTLCDVKEMEALAKEALQADCASQVKKVVKDGLDEVYLRWI